MGVYIDMEMPKDGVYWCEIGVAGDIATITIHGEERKAFPLVPAHEPHGRLIDADKLKSYWEPDHSRYFDADYFIHTIDVAQTIIPASKEG